MGKKFHHDLSKVSKVPEGASFVQLTNHLIYSPAWKAQSINCRKLIDFLLLEHMAHAGLENGNLIATYDQLVESGISSRDYVNKAITEAEKLELILVERGGRRGFTNHLNIFTLTFLPIKCLQSDGTALYAYPPNNWQNVIEEDIKKIKDMLKNN